MPAAQPHPLEPTHLSPGDSFDHSQPYLDTLTSRPARRLTLGGVYNNTPTYHLNSAFSADSRWLVVGAVRERDSLLLRIDTETGHSTVVAVCDATEGNRFAGGRIALVQRPNWVAVSHAGGLRAYHLETFEQRVLIPDEGHGYRFSTPAGSIDGRRVIVPRHPAHPDPSRVSPNPANPQQAYYDACVEKYGGVPTDYLEVDIETGAVRQVFHEDIYGNNHIQPCPAEPDLWLIDRDAPPFFHAGGDYGRTSRCWLLHARTGALTEVRPRHEHRFQVHTNWSFDGEYVLYHGRGGPRGSDTKTHYVGVADRSGSVIWEQEFPLFYYGHAGAHTQTHAIVTDGFFTPDLITAVHYQDLNAAGVPRIEILARHATQWDTAPGQFPHPHPHLSPNGKYLAFNTAADGRADVCLVHL